MTKFSIFVQIQLFNKMQYLNRSIHDRVINKLKPNKVSIILGPRRAGKTILLGEIKKHFQNEDKNIFISKW